MIKLKDLLKEKKFIPTVTIEKYGKEISVEKFKTTNDGIKLRRRRFVNKNQIKTYRTQKQTILPRSSDGLTKPSRWCRNRGIGMV